MRLRYATRRAAARFRAYCRASPRLRGVIHVFASLRPPRVC